MPPPTMAMAAAVALQESSSSAAHATSPQALSPGVTPSRLHAVRDLLDDAVALSLFADSPTQPDSGSAHAQPDSCSAHARPVRAGSPPLPAVLQGVAAEAHAVLQEVAANAHEEEAPASVPEEEAPVHVPEEEVPVPAPVPDEEALPAASGAALLAAGGADESPVQAPLAADSECSGRGSGMVAQGGHMHAQGHAEEGPHPGEEASMSGELAVRQLVAGMFDRVFAAAGADPAQPTELAACADL